MDSEQFARWQARSREFVLGFYRDELVENLALIVSVVLAFALASDWNSRQEQLKETGQQVVVLEELLREVREIYSLASIDLFTVKSALSGPRINPNTVKCQDYYEALRQHGGFKRVIWSSEKVLLLRSISLPTGRGTFDNLADEVDDAYTTIGEMSTSSTGEACVVGLGAIKTRFSDLRQLLQDQDKIIGEAYRDHLGSKFRDTARVIARYVFVWIGFLSLPALVYAVVVLASRTVRRRPAP